VLEWAEKLHEVKAKRLESEKVSKTDEKLEHLREERLGQRMEWRRE
jgi:hypothetical protein